MSIPHIGVLMSRKIFADVLRDRSPYESIRLYDQFARQEGVAPLFFTVEDLRLNQGTVKAYMRTPEGKLIRKVAPIPAVIHNRIKQSHFIQELEILRNLPHVTLFNPDNRLDKWHVYKTLSAHPKVRFHVPETRLLSMASFEHMSKIFPALYVKPRNKSLGIGVRKVELRPDFLLVTSSDRKQKLVLPERKTNWIASLYREGSLLVQQAIRMKSIGNRPVDFRISVQKGREGKWQVSGMVARIGPPGGVATNLAVGGVSQNFAQTLKELKIDKPEKTREQIAEVVLMAAERLSLRDPGLADLGFDVTLDQRGHPWILEVNGRDLRITFYQAKDLSAWQTTFARPMQYAAHLIEQKAKQKENKPSVAIVTPGNLPLTGNSGSVEITAREVAKQLGKFHKVYLVGKVPPKSPHYQSIHIANKTRGAYPEQVCRYVRFVKPNLLQVENRPYWIEKLKASFPHSKKILFLHSDTYLKPPYANPHTIEHALAQYDLLLVNSRFMQGLLAKRFPKLSDKIKAVPLGVDLAHFASIHADPVAKEREIRRAQLGLKDRKVLLFVGRLLPIKGVDFLIDAFHKVHQAHPDAVLWIVGSSFYGKNIETPYVKMLKEKSKPLKEAIRFHPFVPHRRLPQIYQIADVLVTPSIGKEAFGLVNVEGMACGLPILSTQTGGIEEVVEDGVNGRLLPLDYLRERIAECLTEWLKDPALLKQMGLSSRKRAEENFSWERVAKELSEHYQSLLREKVMV
jgi:glycosyltransferase involved in cell wall biosynthesis